MGIEYYAFALFITGLICMIAILCKLLFADVRRQHKLLDEKETKLLRLFQTVEEVMEGFNDQVEEAREEIKKHQDALASREAALRVAAIPERTERYEAPVRQEPVRQELPVRRDAASYGNAAYSNAASYSNAAYGGTADYTVTAPIRAESTRAEATRAEATRAETTRAEAARAAAEIFKPRPVAVTPARTEPHASGGVSVRPYEEPEQQEGGVTFQRMIDELVDDAIPGLTEQNQKNGRNAAILNLREDGKTIAQIARELGITQNEVKLVIGLNQ